jgi:flagellar motor switch protein FliN/FliY
MADPADPTPPSEKPARLADEQAFDAANASFESVPDAEAPAAADAAAAPLAIDDAALKELLQLAEMEAQAAPQSAAPPPPPVDEPSFAGEMTSPDPIGPDTGGFELPNFNQVIADAAASSIDLLRDVELNVKIELGRSRMLVEDVLKLAEGSVVELDKLAGDPVDVFVNDRLVARGEVLVLNDNFCVRVNEIVAGIREEAA